MTISLYYSIVYLFYYSEVLVNIDQIAEVDQGCEYQIKYEITHK